MYFKSRPENYQPNAFYAGFNRGYAVIEKVDAQLIRWMSKNASYGAHLLRHCGYRRMLNCKQSRGVSPPIEGSRVLHHPNKTP
jgi:hypothetical protein